MFSWNSNQYLKFKNERTQPAVDLANRIHLDNPQSIIDIGCGPGNSTEVLQRRFPNSKIIGIDSSAEMIAKAKSQHSDIDFICCDVNDLFCRQERYDVVFSNACIQWIPNHYELIKNLMSLLNDNGVLAVQIPYNQNEPVQKIISKITRSKKWAECFKNPRQKYVLNFSEYYYDLLADVSNSFDMWQTTYFHKMKSYESILEWYRGTGLRPYLEELNEAQKADFESEFLHRVMQEYPVQANGDIIFKFPRLFFTAIR